MSNSGVQPVLPTFLIIGAARSATTALSGQLDQHPDVFITTPKEMHFFAHAGRPTTYNGPGDDEMMNRHIITEPSEYLDLYAAAGNTTARGEGSVSTLYAPQHAPDAIKQWADPNVKLVAMLREPSARAHSSYLYLRSRGRELLQTFAEGLAAEPDRIDRGFHHMWHYSAMSQYSEQLPTFVEAFGDRLLTVVFEEYRDDPATHLASISEHIGIDSTFPFDATGSVNRGGAPRSETFAKSLAALRTFEPISKVIKATTPRSLRERVRQANLAKSDTEVEAPVLAELYEKHEADRQSVYDILGRTVDAWEK